MSLMEPKPTVALLIECIEQAHVFLRSTMWLSTAFIPAPPLPMSAEGIRTSIRRRRAT